MLNWLKRRKANTSSPQPTESPPPRSAAQFRSDGNAWLDRGELAKAEACYREAIAAAPNDVATLINLAFVLNEQSRAADAKPYAELATTLKPDSIDALFTLGTAQVQLADWPGATLSLERVLALQPDFAPAFGPLCRTYFEQALTDKARETVCRGLAVNDQSAELHFIQGNLERTAGNNDAAIENYRRAIALAPAFTEAQRSLGQALFASGNREQGILCLRQAVATAPLSADAHFDLGLALHSFGEIAAAIESYRYAIELRPTQANFHDQIGHALFALEDYDNAAACHRKAISLDPEVPAFHHNLGLTLKGDEALAAFQAALQIDPQYWIAECGIGSVLLHEGKVSAASEQFRKAIAHVPDRLDPRSLLLFASTFDEKCTSDQYRSYAEEYGKVASQAATRPFDHWPVATTRSADLPLSVGLISGDFRVHPVGHFLESVLRHLPKYRIELVAYSTNHLEDGLTERIRPAFAQWKSLVGLSPESAAKVIHADGIELLVDLSGHTAFNMLPLFAWRPAPVQIAWLGYWGSTGVREMDYVVADSHCVPVGEENQFTENIWRLPEVRYCFTAPHSAPEVGPLPALVDGRLTFGSFQKLTKITDATMDLWCSVLRAVPGSRFRLQNAQMARAVAREDVVSRFRQRGISFDRLRLHNAMSRDGYLRAHCELDVILDSVPFTGGSTTCDALWMGVPTATIDGHSMLTRQGPSLMRLVGLSDWVAPDPMSFVATVLETTRDLQKLSAIRKRLREQSRNSPLYDAPRFAKHFADALHAMARRR